MAHMSANLSGRRDTQNKVKAKRENAKGTLDEWKANRKKGLVTVDFNDRSQYSDKLPLPPGGLRDWLIRTGYFRRGYWDAELGFRWGYDRCRCGNKKHPKARRCRECYKAKVKSNAERVIK